MVNLQKTMARGAFLSKFKNYTRQLLLAVEDKIDLEYDHPDLYKRLYNHYKEGDTYFYHDKDRDYKIIIDELEYDLMNAGVIR